MIKSEAVVSGKYRLVAPIGEGGMGAVWRAEHMTLGRHVAIKFIRPESNSPEVAARFLREARATATVRHRNVIDVIDYGTTDDDQVPYIVMELLEGQSLGARLRAAPPLSLAELVDIIGGALNGLHVVHTKGIIHRDLKPENIFLAHDSESIVPKIVDFGISRSGAITASGSEAKLTMTGSVLGTPYYMSPEQVRGVKDIDGRTDIYSMGVILYEALAGQLPFTADTLGGLMVAIATEEAPTLAMIHADVGQPMSDIVAKAMARNRDERYPSAREMRQALIEGASQVRDRDSKSIPPPQTHKSFAHTPATRASLAASTPSAWSSTMQPEGLSRWPLWKLAAGAGAVLALAIVLIVIAVSGGGSEPQPIRNVVASAPPIATATPLVTVRLKGLPAGATLQVDGTAANGPDVELARDGREHTLEVSAAGRRTWTQRHLGAADGEYTVELPALAAAAAPRTPVEPDPPTPQAPRVHRRPAGSATAAKTKTSATATTPRRPGKRPGALLGDPGF